MMPYWFKGRLRWLLRTTTRVASTAAPGATGSKSLRLKLVGRSPLLSELPILHFSETQRPRRSKPLQAYLLFGGLDDLFP